MDNIGKVFLVGAGPGSPELLTIRAKQIIDTSDVILYDDLLCKSLLKGSGAELIHVGKRKGSHSIQQNEIHELMYSHAMSGKKVCRLKGGDPFIFGRGGEELSYLQDKGIPVEVIPGVTAALSAASSAGISLTRRLLASSVAFCAGHPDNSIQVPSADTLIYYMGSASLSLIVQRVLESGRPAQTPVALIQNTSLPSETVQLTTLQTILEESISVESPAIVIIGNVVSQGKDQHRQRVLFTGTDPSSCRLDATLVHSPLISISPLEDYSMLDRFLAELWLVDWIIFTSKFSVNYFMKRLLETGKDVRFLHNCKIASIGETTSQQLRQWGIRFDLQSETASSAGLVKIFPDFNLRRGRILLPSSDQALTILPEGLRALGYHVDIVPIYTNRIPENLIVLDLRLFAGVVFTSPSTVLNFKALYGNFPEDLHYYVQGEETEKELRAWINSGRIERLKR